MQNLNPTDLKSLQIFIIFQNPKQGKMSFKCNKNSKSKLLKMTNTHFNSAIEFSSNKKKWMID